MALVKFNGTPNVFVPSFATLVDDFLGDISNRTGSDLHRSIPAVNIYESKDHYTLEFAAPGLNKEDFNIHVDNKTLSVSAEKKQDKEKQNENVKFNRREFSYGSFKRTFSLPDSVHVDGSMLTMKMEY